MSTLGPVLLPQSCASVPELPEEGSEKPHACEQPYIPVFQSIPEASTHLHGRPQTLYSSQGVCSWGNPAAGGQKESVTSHRTEDRCQQYLTTQMAGSPQPRIRDYRSKEDRKGLSFRIRVGDAQDTATTTVH